VQGAFDKSRVCNSLVGGGGCQCPTNDRSTFRLILNSSNDPLQVRSGNTNGTTYQSAQRLERWDRYECGDPA
jgi:hypothetical protein